MRVRIDWKAVPAVITDTSVLMAYFLNEPGVEDLSTVKRKLRIPFMALCELHYVVSRKQGRGLADQCYGLVKSWDVPVLHSTEEAILAASRLKDRYDIGLGDAFIAAYSLCERLPLLTYDSNFIPLRKEISLLGVE